MTGSNEKLAISIGETLIMANRKCYTTLAPQSELFLNKLTSVNILGLEPNTFRVTLFNGVGSGVEK